MLRGPSTSFRRAFWRAATPALLLLIAPLPSAALDPGRPTTQFGMDLWQRKQGLPSGSVAAVAQTSDGYLWVGTEEGLARFDGFRFSVYDRRNTPQLDRHNVTTLLAARDGSLWIGTLGGGLKHYRAGVFESFTTSNGLAEDIVSALAEDPDGALWIGTFSRGVWRRSGGRFIPLTTREGLTSDEIRALYRASDGSLWIGTRGGGVDRWKDGRVAAWTTREGLSNDQVTAVCGDGQGGVWVATRGGLDRITSSGLTAYGKGDGLSDDAVISVARDRDGNVWAGTVAGGLNRFVGGRWTSFSGAQGLSNETVRCLVEDRDGSVWIGTSAGLDRLRPGRFASYSTQEGLSADDVRPILETRDGSLWIGTLGGGLNQWKDGVFRAWRARDGLASDRVWSLHEDSSGALWVGTREGVSRFASGRWTTYRKADGLSHDLVLAIAGDRDGAVWLGTAGGLDRWKDGKFTNYGRRDGLSNERVTAIVPGPDGSLWLGTMGGGLDRWKDGRFESVGDERLRRAFVNDILPDPDGTLWVGTAGLGLFRYRDGRWTSITTKDGLFDDVVYRILEDRDHRLWMSSNRGVFCVSREELDDFARGRRRSVASLSFGISDGMKESECNGAFQPAGWRSRDGRLWFPTIRGAAVVDPRSAVAAGPAPLTRVEAVLADGRPVPLEGPSRLPSGTGRLEFEYTAIELISPEKLRFRYRLDGFDAGWIEAGASRVASYTNVPARSYRFRVQAFEEGSRRAAREAAFAFAIAPRFYRTWWFAIGSVVAILLAAAVAHRTRLRGARLNAELATARLQTLRAQLQPHFLFNSINMILPLIYRDPDAASRTLVLLGDLLRRTIEWDATKLVPLSAEIEFVRKYLEIQLVRFEARLATRVSIDPQVQDSAVPNLLLQPLVENAIKHGISRHPGRGEIEIACRRDRARLEIRVWNTVGDSGGFSPESRGVGLTNLRDRLAAIYGGRYELVTSRERDGFEVVIRLPLAFVFAEESPDDPRDSETPRSLAASPGSR